MPHPALMFCPYLEIKKSIEFADWRIGPMTSFEGKWKDAAFEKQAKAFLATFTDGSGDPIKTPSLVCRKDGALDGSYPTLEEMEALQLSLAFGFLDENPRNAPGGNYQGWSVLTADNAELYVWPIDVATGEVTVSTGLMVRNISGGYTIADEKLVIRPPLDLHMPLGSRAAQADCVEALYKVLLSSLQAPGTNLKADRVRAAVDWFVKAWRNTATVHFPERVVFVKTAFESLTATSKSYESGKKLRALFEAVPDTDAADSELLIWSPAEQPTHARNYTKNGQPKIDYITDLQLWFMRFAEARNAIIHDGASPNLNYVQPGSAYEGHMVFTAEFLLRAAIKIELQNLGYPDLWRSPLWRIIKATYERLNAEPPA
jgi:hypothetical protein